MSEDVFRWVVAVGVLLACLSAVVQATILVALYLAGKKAEKASRGVIAKVGPVVERVEALVKSAGNLVEENRPRVVETISEIAQITKAVHKHADRVGALIDQTSDLATVRIAQIDQAVGNAVAEVEHASDAVKGAVLKPVKEVNGLVAGVKAAFSTLAQGNRHSPEDATQDEEMFI